MVPMPPPQAQPPKRNNALVVALIVALLLGGGIGLMVSMSNTDDGNAPAAAATPAGGTPLSQLGTLEVVSVPPDGTVTVDARLVGLTPIDRLDLAAGRHAVVIEVHGYQPYIGTITIEARGASALEAHLAEIGKQGHSTGRHSGAGQAVDRVPAAPPAAAPEAEAKSKSRSRSTRSRPRAPRRNCSNEESACNSKCDDAQFSCWSGCQYCGSCVTSMTSEECNRICNTCRDGCERNEKFCEATCEGVGDACRASQ